MLSVKKSLLGPGHKKVSVIPEPREPLRSVLLDALYESVTENYTPQVRKSINEASNKTMTATTTVSDKINVTTIPNRLKMSLGKVNPEPSQNKQLPLPNVVNKDERADNTGYVSHI
jgi:hypothetical protein